jgi:hypothetical protein
MTELEMTRLAAKAMQIDETTHWPGRYDPLNNAAQAFELIEKLQMLCMTNIKHKWVCRLNGGHAENADLKRAIVECAANYQLEKEKQA